MAIGAAAAHNHAMVLGGPFCTAGVSSVVATDRGVSGTPPTRPLAIQTPEAVEGVEAAIGAVENVAGAATMAIEPDDTYVHVEGHEFNQVPDGYVIYQSERDRVHFLNPTAVIVYELCDGKHTVEQIGRFMQQSYSLPAPPLEEVKACLQNLLDEEIVKPWTQRSSAA